MSVSGRIILTKIIHFGVAHYRAKEIEEHFY